MAEEAIRTMVVKRGQTIQQLPMCPAMSDEAHSIAAYALVTCWGEDFNHDIFPVRFEDPPET